VQVSSGFDGGGEWVGPACRRDSNHDHFVSWDTRFQVSHALKSALRLEKSLFRALNWSFSDISSLFAAKSEPYVTSLKTVDFLALSKATEGGGCKPP
jgi:hypothetical protein